MPVVQQGSIRPAPVPGAVPAARVIDARKVYGQGPFTVTALDGVSADFPAGEFTAVMGPSGSGKSAHADRVLFMADGRIAGSIDWPTAQRVLDWMKGLGR